MSRICKNRIEIQDENKIHFHNFFIVYNNVNINFETKACKMPVTTLLLVHIIRVVSELYTQYFAALIFCQI